MNSLRPSPAPSDFYEDGYETIESTLSPATLCYFPMLERSGDTMTCIKTGSVIEKAAGAASFSNPYAVTYDGSNTIGEYATGSLTENKMESKLIDSGVFLYFSCSTWNKDATGNIKESFSHYTVNGNVIDVQQSVFVSQNETAGTNNRTATMAYDNRGYLPYPENAPGSFTAYISAGTRDVIHTNGGHHALAVMLEVGKHNGANLFFDFGKVPQQATLYPNKTNIVTPFQTNPWQQSGWPGLSGWEPTHKWLDLYCWGAYHFENFKPTDVEIVEMLKWVSQHAKAGDKRMYPKWVDKT